MKHLSIWAAVTLTFFSCAVFGYAQSISGKGAAGYTASSFYDRSVRDVQTSEDAYLHCAYEGYLYNPSDVQADATGCVSTGYVAHEFNADRSQLRIQNPDGTWGDWVTVKGDVGDVGEMTRIACIDWTVGDWSACNGSNQMTRAVTCNDARGCCAPRPAAQKSCSCDGTWLFDGWGDCLGSQQQARYKCSTSCCNGSAPADTQVCGQQGTWQASYGSCTASPSWQTASWGACSSGQQTRTVTCINQEGQRLFTGYTCSTSSGCSGSAPAPLPSQACSLTCQGAGLEKPATEQDCTTAQACDTKFQNPRTCTRGKCWSGYRVQTSFGGADGTCPSANGNFSVTIQHNGDSQRVQVGCGTTSHNRETSCVDTKQVTVGGGTFGLEINASVMGPCPGTNITADAFSWIPSIISTGNCQP